MDWVIFSKWYAVGCVPIFLLALINIRDRLKFKNFDSVRVSGILNTVCIFSLFVALLGGLTNLFDCLYLGGTDWWFVNLMFFCYFSMIILCLVMYDERIIYNKISGDIICSINFKKTKFNVSEITRFNFSTEYIDLYIKEKRIRFHNNYLIGTYDFEQYIKEFFNADKI